MPNTSLILGNTESIEFLFLVELYSDNIEFYGMIRVLCLQIVGSPYCSGSIPMPFSGEF